MVVQWFKEWDTEVGLERVISESPAIYSIVE